MKNNRHKFGIGQHIQFGESGWYEVARYHRVGGQWEVMFRDLTTGKHVSIPCRKLELFS